MSDLDTLMTRDPLSLTAQDIDAIIAYHRQARARKASGEKPTKPAGPSIDISHITSKLVKANRPTIKLDRRI